MKSGMIRQTPFATYLKPHKSFSHSCRRWLVSTFAMTLVGASMLTAPVLSYADDDDDEEALGICLLLTFPLTPAMLGCAAGYVIFGSSSAGTHPKFHFADSAGGTVEPLGGNVLYFDAGNRERLTVGLWKGCPPDCMVEPRLSPAKEDVERVIFRIVETERLVAAKGFNAAEWRILGDGEFNPKSHAWELDWDSRGHSAQTGYVLRADFVRADGSRQTGVGLAMPSWSKPVAQ